MWPFLQGVMDYSYALSGYDSDLQWKISGSESLKLGAAFQSLNERQEAAFAAPSLLCLCSIGNQKFGLAKTL